MADRHIGISFDEASNKYVVECVDVLNGRIGLWAGSDVASARTHALGVQEDFGAIIDRTLI